MANISFAVFCFHLLSTTITVTALYNSLPCFAFYYSWFASFILYSFIAFSTYNFSEWCFYRGKIETRDKAVLITGCDTGFGNELAKRLDSRGFKVFASCLFPEGNGAADLKRNCSDNLKVLYLDVTKDESVEKALNFVKQDLESSELWALVNNAGISKGFFTEFASIDVFREVMEVNTIGPVRVTKAFLPLLRNSKGRVVNVTSLAGRISPLLLCAYSMSKHASVAFTECLSQELKAWDVTAISIEPELFNTPITDPKKMISYLEEDFRNTSDEILNAYGEEFRQKLKQFMILVRYIAGSPRIDLVIDDMESAIIDKYPKYVYKSRHNVFTRLFWCWAEVIPIGLLMVFVGLLDRVLDYPTPKDAKKKKKKCS